MDFLTKDEFDVMLDPCDTSEPIGARDKPMLMILYNSGVRVSEMLALRLQKPSCLYPEHISGYFLLDGQYSVDILFWGRQPRWLL